MGRHVVVDDPMYDELELGQRALESLWVENDVEVGHSRLAIAHRCYMGALRAAGYGIATLQSGSSCIMPDP